MSVKNNYIYYATEDPDGTNLIKKYDIETGNEIFLKLNTSIVGVNAI